MAVLQPPLCLNPVNRWPSRSEQENPRTSHTPTAVFTNPSSFTSDSPMLNLGIILDQHLSCVHICDILHILPMLDYKTPTVIATSVVHTKYDYCNVLS